MYRDADETIAWIAEKDAVISIDDFGKDLGSVQTLQRKHEGVERDLAALEVSVKKTKFDIKKPRTLVYYKKRFVQLNINVERSKPCADR